MTEIDTSWYRRPADVPERIASGGIVVRPQNGQIFVALTREEDMEEYVLPKGGVEPGESLLEAAQREIQEETGIIDLTFIKKLEVVERLTFDKAYWAIIHLYLFYTKQVEATPTDSSHHFGVGWFPIDQLPRFMWPEQRELLVRHHDEIVREIDVISLQAEKANQKDIQWAVILKIVTYLEKTNIPYHIDSSSTLFVHGIDIDIKDIDISIEFDRFEETRSLMQDYDPTPIIQGDPWHQFHIYPQGVDVHFLTTARMTDLAANPDRVHVTYGETAFWSLSVEWCRRHTPDDHERAPIIDQYLADQNPSQTPVDKQQG